MFLLLFGMDNDVLNGFFPIERLIDETLLKLGKAINGSFAFRFFSDRFCVENGLGIAAHVFVTIVKLSLMLV
jgi:hypothetical protein